MTIFKGKTIEGFISFWLTLFIILFLFVFVTLLWHLSLSFWQIALMTSAVALLCITAVMHFRKKVIASFGRALLHLDAVRLEDYKQYAKPIFSEGIVARFHQQLRGFSEDLAAKKQRYDQHAFLIYQLIDQLDTPVLVFNHKDKLTYANSAFGQLYDNQPWQRFRHASPKLLKLIKTDAGWQLQQKNQQWQISQSIFIDSGSAHQLLIFTNIESAVRSSQVQAWQQIISVMGHEIRNSLTPVSAIAESLSDRAQNARDKDALALISERCLHLQDFINRYASVSRQINLNYQDIEVAQFGKRLKGLFSELKLQINIDAQWLWADATLLEQVLINLIKNAHEAGAANIVLQFTEDASQSIIKVEDDGHGFSNLENVFVPLFTTKQEGQGIGLSFCRNIVEQHNGKISLLNNRTKGVTVTLSLPFKSA